jgi:hypothetical protein
MLRAVLAVACLVALSGCGVFGDDIIDPIVTIPSEKTLVVVPFKDEDFRDYCQSPRGADLALRVSKILEGKAECKVKPIEEVIALFDDKNPRELSLQEIADKVDADYLFLGDVRTWRTQDPGAINLLHGTSVIDIQIFERYVKPEKGAPEPKNKKGRVVRSAEVSANFPNEYGMGDVGEPSVGHTHEEVDLGLRAVTARRVAQLMYGHTKDEAHLTQEQ